MKNIKKTILEKVSSKDLEVFTLLLEYIDIKFKSQEETVEKETTKTTKKETTKTKNND